MIKKLCIISSYYPSAKDSYYTFVGTLVEQFADMGIECHVITPVSQIEKAHKGRTRVEKTQNGVPIFVYCPRYFVFPSRVVAGFYTYKLTVWSLWSSIWKCYRKNIKNCDAIYSHFIESGLNAAWLKRKTGIPAFMAIGESRLKDKELTYTQFKDILYKGLNGVICVSSSLKEELIEKDIIGHNVPITIQPNAIDCSVFYPRDKQCLRSFLGIKENEFVVSFVGGFIERKGFDILQTVLGKHPEWKCIMIGSGDLPITVNAEQIIYCGKTEHNKIPNYLSAADVFVLPTKAEGCCNAIIEAMGCGLPIISSDLPFNWDILSKENALFIDPENVEELDNALIQIEGDVLLRKRLSKESLERVRVLSVEKRAMRIVAFMEQFK